MRQGQQNRRGRGRGGNRKNQNPLTRSFESSGPDVKIRGTPAHIAEKYMTYARDALSSSDPVLAENYLQHAEHYNRIIMTYREQQAQQNGDNANGSGRQPTSHASSDNSETSNDEAVAAPNGAEAGQGAAMASEAAEGSQAQQPRNSRTGARQRRSRSNDSSNGNGQQRGRRRPPAQQASQPAEGFSDESEQPEFLKRPVRRPRRTKSTDGDQQVVDTSASDDAGAE